MRRASLALSLVVTVACSENTPPEPPEVRDDPPEPQPARDPDDEDAADTNTTNAEPSACASRVEVGQAEDGLVIAAARSTALVTGRVRRRTGNSAAVRLSLSEARAVTIDRWQDQVRELVFGRADSSTRFFLGPNAEATLRELEDLQRGDLVAVWAHPTSDPRVFVPAWQATSAVVEDVAAASSSMLALREAYVRCAPRLVERIARCGSEVVLAFLSFGSALRLSEHAHDVPASDSERDAIRSQVAEQQTHLNAVLERAARNDPATVLALMSTQLADGEEATTNGGAITFGHLRGVSTFSSLDAALSESFDLEGCATTANHDDPARRLACVGLWASRIDACADDVSGSPVHRLDGRSASPP
jgi:hypothetical protein